MTFLSLVIQWQDTAKAVPVFNARCVCVRCHERYSSPRKFGEHLAECSTPIDVMFVFEVLEVDTSGDCWIMRDSRTTRIPKLGVGYKKVMKASHIVAEAEHGPCPDSLMLCHWCDNIRCLRPVHLYWGTARENARDAWRNKRRDMSAEQQDAMQEARRHSVKNKARMAEHNKRLGEVNRGENHWTRKNPEACALWVRAMSEGRARARLQKEVMPK